MHLSPYATYKDFGEPWFGDIPAHWAVQRLKRCAARFYAGGTPDSGSADCYCSPPDGIPWLMIADMTRQRRVRTTTKAITERGRLSRRLEIIPKGTVLYSMYASLGAASILEIDATVNQAIIGIAPNDQVLDREFLLYVLENNRRHVNVLATSSTQANLNAEKVKSLPIPLPPPAEQAGIVRFLGVVDRKVGRFIRAKRRLIEVLTEQKQAIITHAVTKGLNPHAPLKPSGIDWLGDVPEHWEVRKLRTLFRRHGSGTTPAGDAYYGGSVPWVMTGDLKDKVLAATQRTVTAKALEEVKALRMYPADSLLVAMYGATIGKTGILSMAACTNQACCVLAEPRPEANVRFLQAFVIMARPQLVQQSYGGGQPNINSEIVLALRIPLPPRAEQDAILEAIGQRTGTIDAAIDRASREIDLIREYRTRLVADVVTGKLDVRGVAPGDLAAEAQGDPPPDLDPADEPADAGDEADAPQTPEEAEA